MNTADIEQLDRPAIARAVAKMIAHRQAGNDELAAQWAAHLLYLMDLMGVMTQSQQWIDDNAWHAPAR